MKSLEELKELYSSKLKWQLFGFEAQRKEIVKNLWLYGGGSIVLAIICLFANPRASGIILVAGIGALIATNGQKYSEYQKGFKKGVVAEIVRLIDESWYYNSEEHISLSDYRASKLFTRSADRYIGDDLVKGTIDKTDFEFSEFLTQYKKTYRKINLEKDEKWITIFKGLFFHADFNKTLKGETVVLPDITRGRLGEIGREYQEWSSRGELVKLENVEFEKEFVVYGADQIESRYILTPLMMEKMLEVKRKYDKKMHFSFIGSRVYCGVSIKKDMFEPRLFQSGVRFEDVNEIYDYFALIKVLITEMNLNTRIWAKD